MSKVPALFATRPVLLRGLQFLAAFIPDRSSHPLWTAVHVAPDGRNLITLQGRGSDGAAGFVQVPAEIPVGGFAPFVLGAHLLTQLVRVAPGDLVEIESRPEARDLDGNRTGAAVVIRSGSFALDLVGADVEAYPVAPVPELHTLTFGAAFDLVAVRDALRVSTAESYHSWTRRAYLFGAAVGTSDGMRIGRAALDLPGVAVADHLTADGRALLGTLAGIPAGSVVAAALTRRDEAPLMVLRVEAPGGLVGVLTVPLMSDYEAPAGLVATVAGADLGESLCTLPALSPAYNPALFGRAGKVGKARPWSAATIKKAVSPLAVVALLPSGDYVGVSADGGSVASLPGAGDGGLPGRAVVMRPAALVEFGAAGATAHKAPAFAVPVWRSEASGAVGVLGYKRADGVELGAVVSVEEWSAFLRDLRGRYWAGRADEFRREVRAALREEYPTGALLRLADGWADVEAAARDEGHTVPAAVVMLRAVLGDVVHGARAERDGPARRKLVQAWRAAVEARDRAGRLAVAAAPALSKAGKPKRVPVTLTRAAEAARKECRAALGTLDERRGEYHAAAVAVGRLLDVSSVVLQEPTRDAAERARTAYAALLAGDVSNLEARAAAVTARRLAVVAAPVVQADPVAEVEAAPEVPAAVVMPEVEAEAVAVVLEVEPAPVLNGAGPVGAYHCARAYLLTLAGVQARRAAVVPFLVPEVEVHPAPEGERGPVVVPEVEAAPAAAVCPAGVLGALEALALVAPADLVALGARVAAGDPVAVEAGRAAAVVLAALTGPAPWRARRVSGIEAPPVPAAPRTPAPVPVLVGVSGPPVRIDTAARDMTAPHDTAPGVPVPAPAPSGGTLERTVAGSGGRVVVRVSPDGGVIILAGGVEYAGRVSGRGVLSCGGDWVRVAGRKAVEVRGAVLDLARLLGVTA